MNKKITNKDKKDWENFLSNEEPLPNKDYLYTKEKKSVIRSIDLHGFGLEEANKRIQSFIEKSYHDGIAKLKIITGKGLHSDNEKDPYISKNFGILKNSVPEFIKNNSDLMRIIQNIENASIEDGGGGAFYIILKKKL